MKIRTWKYFIREGLYNILRNRVMSFASIISIMSALFILGVILVVVFNLNHFAGDFESKMEITAFLKKEVEYNDITSLRSEMAKWEGVYQVDFVSRHQALQEWKKELGEKGTLLEGYSQDNNPLPDKLILKVKKPEYVEQVAAKAKSLQAVEKVNYSKEVAEVIDSIVNTTRIVGLAIVVLLTIISMVIINNTIRITVYSRRREVSIMKYIGATDWYIRWPFIIEGFTLGVIGSALAVALVVLGYRFLVHGGGNMATTQGFINLFELLPIEDMIGDIAVIFFVVGSGVGTVASILSIHKHLKV